MTKAAIYARVSRDEQAKSDKYSLPTQIADIKEYCEKNNYAVVKTYTEDESGLIFERPELQKMLTAGALGEFEVVVSLCLDRLARGITSYTLTTGALDAIGVRYEYVQGGALDDSPESQLTSEIAAVISGYEAKKIRERSMRGRNGRAKAGGYLRGVMIPYGYSYLPKSADTIGELVVNPEEAEIVRMIFDWYLEGYGTVAIAGKLSAMGIKRRGNWNGRSQQRSDSAWSGATVIYMLKNETYAGTYHYGKRKTVGHKVVKGKRVAITEYTPDDTIKVAVPAIVKREVWDMAQMKRVTNRETSARNTKRFYLMQGQLYCSVCGTKFRAYTARDKQRNGVVREYRYYQCSGQLRDRSPDGMHATCRGNINADKLDFMAWCSLRDFFNNPDHIAQMVSREETDKEEKRSRKAIELKHITTKIDSFDEKLKMILELYLEKQMDKDTYVNQRQMYNSQKLELEVKRKQLQKEISTVTTDPNRLARINQFGERIRSWEFYDPEVARKAILETQFIGEITREEGGGFAVHFSGFAPDNYDDLLIADGILTPTNSNLQVATGLPFSFNLSA